MLAHGLLCVSKCLVPFANEFVSMLAMAMKN